MEKDNSKNKWKGRSLNSYKERNINKAKQAGVGKEFLNCRTLTQARKLIRSIGSQ